MYNFINNALTYTGDDKTVRVNLYHKTPTTARLEVCDSGIGIDPENLKYVWDRYYRVKKDGEGKASVSAALLPTAAAAPRHLKAVVTFFPRHKRQKDGVPRLRPQF